MFITKQFSSGRNYAKLKITSSNHKLKIIKKQSKLNCYCSVKTQS